MIKKTPYEMWYGKRPDLQNLKVFGCIAYAHVPDANRQRFDKKATRYRFVGYSLESKEYRLLDENTCKIYIRRDVIFNENNFGHQSEKPMPQQEGTEVDTKSEEQKHPENQLCSEQPEEQQSQEQQPEQQQPEEQQEPER